MIEAMLEGALKGIDVVMINRGVSGELAAGAALRMRNEVALDEPDLVLWQVGTNDALAYVPVDEFTAMVKEQIEWLKAHKVDLVLVGLQFAPQMRRDAHYVALRDALRKLAGEEKVIVIRFYEAMQILNQRRGAARRWSNSSATRRALIASRNMSRAPSPSACSPRPCRNGHATRAAAAHRPPRRRARRTATPRLAARTARECAFRAADRPHRRPSRDRDRRPRFSMARITFSRKSARMTQCETSNRLCPAARAVAGQPRLGGTVTTVASRSSRITPNGRIDLVLAEPLDAPSEIGVIERDGRFIHDAVLSYFHNNELINFANPSTSIRCHAVSRFRKRDCVKASAGGRHACARRARAKRTIDLVLANRAQKAAAIGPERC